MKRKKLEIIIEPAISIPVLFDSEVCNGCNQCLEVCQVDLFVPNPEKGRPPLLYFPGECWYCGCCVGTCPRPGAVKLNVPLMNKVHWKAKIPSP